MFLYSFYGSKKTAYNFTDFVLLIDDYEALTHCFYLHLFLKYLLEYMKYQIGFLRIK